MSGRGRRDLESEELLKAGIYTDFLYYKDGKRGLWLEVVKDYENG